MFCAKFYTIMFFCQVIYNCIFLLTYIQLYFLTSYIQLYFSCQVILIQLYSFWQPIYNNIIVCFAPISIYNCIFPAKLYTIIVFLVPSSIQLYFLCQVTYNCIFMPVPFVFRAGRLSFQNVLFGGAFAPDTKNS